MLFGSSATLVAVGTAPGSILLTTMTFPFQNAPSSESCLFCLPIRGSCVFTQSNFEIPRRRQWHPTPVLLLGESHGRRSLVGCSPWGREESDTTEQLHFTFHFHALEKEMATHSSVLAWRIPRKGSLVGCHLWGRTESDTTKVT